MKILTYLSKEKINSVVQLEKSYNFNIDIDNKKYEATLYGYSVVIDFSGGEIINSKIKIRNISFEDMSILNFQVGQRIQIDDEDYYVSNIIAEGFCQRVEVTMVKKIKE